MGLENLSKQEKMEMYNQLNEIVENAKRDLSTGIKKEDLEEFHNKNYFTNEQSYIEIKNAIELLENIVNTYSPIVDQLKKELDL